MASFDERLITLYQSHPCLYAKKDSSYKDVTMKGNIWATISREMNSKVDICQARMKVLRERYCRERKNVFDIRSGSKATTKEPWPLFNMLVFLNDHMKPRHTISNLESTQPETTHDSQTSGIEEVESPSVEDISSFDSIFVNELERAHPVTYAIGSSGNSSEVTPSVRKRKPVRPESDATISEHLRMVAEATNRFSETFERRNSAVDVDAAFSNYIVSELSSLPEVLKDSAKMEIMRVLMETKRMKRSSDI